MGLRLLLGLVWGLECLSVSRLKGSLFSSAFGVRVYGLKLRGLLRSGSVWPGSAADSACLAHDLGSRAHAWVGQLNLWRHVSCGDEVVNPKP